jgi:WD40 repeat protein
VPPSRTLRHGGRPWLTALAVTVLAPTVLAACSGGGSSGPPIEDDVVSLRLDAVSAWGDGRAQRVAVSDDLGVVAVATTTGVVALGAEGTEPVRLADFDTSPGSVALDVSPDGSSAVVATSIPPTVTRYDTTTGAVLASAALVATAVPVTAAARPDGSVLLETAEGPLRWGADGSAPEPLVPAGTPIGRSALLADGTVVTPLAGTAQLSLTTAAGTAAVPLQLGDQVTVGDAVASPSGAAVAVTAGTGADAFERVDDVVVLDPTATQVLGRVSTGLALRPEAWAVTDGAIAVADQGTVIVRGFDGAELASIPSPSGAAVDRLIGVEQGVVAVYGDGVIILHRAGTWAAVPVRVPVGRVVDVALTTDTGTLAGVDVYGEITLWGLADGAPLRTIDRFRTGELTGVDVDPTGQRVAVTSTDGTVTVLDAALAEQSTLTVANAPLRVDSVRFDPIAGGLVTGNAERLGAESFDDTLTMWDLATGGTRYSVGGEREDVSGCSFFLHRIAFTSDGSALVSASHDFSIEVLDPASGEVLTRLPPRAGSILDLAFTPDDELLVVTADDSRVEVWQTADWTLAASYDAPMGGYFAIATLADDATFAAVDITGGISLVDVMTGEVVGSIPGTGQRTSALAASPDGRMLAAPGLDGSVMVWAGSGRLLAEIPGHTAPVTDLAFSPDSAALLTVSSDGTALRHALALTDG